jgi:diphthamide synthase (EF-2-diphthine--ammonia ligase)
MGETGEFHTHVVFKPKVKKVKKVEVEFEEEGDDEVKVSAE